MLTRGLKSSSRFRKPVFLVQTKRFNILEQKDDNKIKDIKKKLSREIYLGLGFNDYGFAIKIGKKTTNINIVEKLIVFAAYAIISGLVAIPIVCFILY